MAKLTLIFGPAGSGKSSTARNLAGKRKTYEAEYHRPGEPILLSMLLHIRPEVVILDELPLEELDRVISFANSKETRIQHPVTGLHKIKTPDVIVILQNSVPAEAVYAQASGRNIQLIECARKEVIDG